MQAETTPTEAAPTALDRRTEFVPVTGSSETTSAEALLLAAYLLMWALVFGFVWLTMKRQAKLDRRLKDVEAELSRLDAAAQRPGA